MVFTPSRLAIADITQANPAVVTTTTDHNLTTGQIVRLHVPPSYGMSELNQRQVSIKVLSDTEFSVYLSQVPNNTISVNSSDFTPFVIPSNPGFTAEVIPMGSGPIPITNTIAQQTNNVCDSLISDATSNISTSEIPF